MLIIFAEELRLGKSAFVCQDPSWHLSCAEILLVYHLAKQIMSAGQQLTVVLKSGEVPALRECMLSSEQARQ